MSGITQGWRCWWSSLVVGGLLIASLQECVVAQITPDSTLPNNSVVTPDGSTLNITGGTQAGSNLFHSFGEFSVPTGGAASFNNAVDIQNIISRVTGGSVSTIDGIIRANGTANLFLINPNGIIFGQNAQLNIGGSFVGTTANALQFGNLGFFSATDKNIPSPLLTINPSALLFNQINQNAAIQSSSVAPTGTDPAGFNAFGLRVPDGKSLLLVGGDININGGQLNGFGGRVELGGLAGTGTIGLNGDGNNLSLSFPYSVPLADVLLDNGATLDLTSNDIQLVARRIVIAQGSTIVANALESKPGGRLTLTASDSVQLIGRSVGGFSSSLLTATQNTQAAGDLSIQTGKLIVQDGAQVSASTFGQGNGGSLTVDAQNVQLIGGSADGRFPSGLFASAQLNSTGDAGSLTIRTNTLLVKDGAEVSASTFGQGNGGSLTVDAKDDVQLIGGSADGRFPSGLSASAQPNSTGLAGDVTINTNTLLVKDGAEVSASTFGRGKGGNLTVNAKDDVQLIGGSADGRFPSGLSASAQPNSTGLAGDVTINTNTLLVKDGAQLTVSNRGRGSAGRISSEAFDIRLDNQGKITAASVSGRGGDIELKTANLILLHRNSLISATSGVAGSNGLDGNINIDTKFLIAVPSENSDIVATSFGRTPGSNIQVNAEGIFGTQFRQQLSPESDIVATGQVTLNTPDVEPNSGLVNLPTIPVDTQVAQTCQAGGTLAKSSFTITGRGGLPPNPGEVLNTDAVQVDLITLNPSTRNSNSPPVTIKPTTATPKPIVEATGWVMNAKGELELTANAPATTPHGSWQNPVSCRAS